MTTKIDRRSFTSRQNLLKARKVRNRNAYLRSLERARVIQEMFGHRVTTESLADYLGIQPQSVPSTIRRALERVREADNAKGPTEVEPLQ
jgi:hypothetical protein